MNIYKHNLQHELYQRTLPVSICVNVALKLEMAFPILTKINLPDVIFLSPTSIGKGLSDVYLAIIVPVGVIGNFLSFMVKYFLY